MKPLVKNKHIDCIRCGICCVSGSCSKGKPDENGVCLHLSYDGEKASCKLFEEGKVSKEEIGINGTGCVLRKNNSIFEYYEKSTSWFFKKGC